MANKTKHSALTFFNSFIIQNIVLVQAINLCPIVAAGTTLQNGVALAACTAAVLLPISLTMSLCGEKIPAWVRPLVYTLMAVLLTGGAALLLRAYVSEELYAALYLFLPLTAVSSVFTYRAGGFSVRNDLLNTLLDSLGSSLGFGLVICAVSAIREIAAYGTIWGIVLRRTMLFPQAAWPFFAFFLLAIMAALLQWAKNGVAYWRKKKEVSGRE